MIVPVVMNDRKKRKQRIKRKTKKQKVPGPGTERNPGHAQGVLIALLLSFMKAEKRKGDLALDQEEESIPDQIALRELKGGSTGETKAMRDMIKKMVAQGQGRERDQDPGHGKGENGDLGRPLYRGPGSTKALNLGGKGHDLDHAPRKESTSQKRCHRFLLRRRIRGRQMTMYPVFLYIVIL